MSCCWSQREGTSDLHAENGLVVLRESDQPPRRRALPWPPLLIVASVVIVAALGWLPIHIAALLGCIGLIAIRTLSSEEAVRAVDWRVLLLIAGMLPLGIAMQQSGLAQSLVQGLLDVTGVDSPHVAVAILYLMTAILTEFMSNNAAAVLMVPIGLSLAEHFGADWKPFLVAVAFAASTAFATPVGYQTNTMVFNAGNYRFADFVRVGTPLNLVFWIAASLLIPQVREKVEKRIRKEYPEGIRAVGADALRFTFAALATHGRTINFDLKRCEGYKAFCNKLWNAARFVLMNTEGFSAPAGATVPARSEAERWILTRLAETLAEVEAGFAAYRFDLVAQALYEFTWNDYCDWFVELAKPALADAADADAAASTRTTLLHVLETLLRALHPIIPFISEAIWQEVAPKLGRGGPSISRAHYPRSAEAPRDAAAAAEIGWLKEAVSGIRRIRSEMNIAPSKAIPLRVAGGDAEDHRRIGHFEAALRFLARLESIARVDGRGDKTAAAIAVVGELRLLIPLVGLIDLDAERARLAREINRIEGEIRKCQGKLGTDTFVRNAPALVVEQERTRLADFTTSLAALRAQAAKLGAG